MDQQRADRLDRHRREIRRTAWLNIILTAALAGGLGIVLGGPVRGLLTPLFGGSTAMAIVLIVIGLLWITYSLPLLHYREEYTVRSDRDPDHYLERGIDRLPLVMLLEEQGWEEIETEEDRIRLGTYPTRLHRLLGRRSTLELEVIDREGDTETAVLRSDGEERERSIARIEPAEDGGSLIHEVSVSRRRTSPAQLEVLLLILPQLQEMLQTAAEEDMEIVDEQLDYGFAPYELPEP